MRAARPVPRVLLVCAGAFLACTTLTARALPPPPDPLPAPRASDGHDGLHGGMSGGLSGGLSGEIPGDPGGPGDAPVTLVARTVGTGPARCVRRTGPEHAVLHCRMERATLTDAVVTVRTGDRPTTARIAHAALSGALEVDLVRLGGRLAGLLPVRVTADLPLPVAVAPALELTDVTLAADRVSVEGGRVRDSVLLIRP
ncbi:hypothetical protein BLA24_06710 [Streptomyces cinnamoneus]|uniref:DUF2993 domain-containing protein n=1 Tax=Streptomyces cinnamoneus TaxID=53446 RepID=A0A2G1XMK9_STRCJ|nr:hypothetical protein [Streptomyces cinnamoneus]PHQ52468.1 hypothetical protein BLA24_06710 [Streptomyces cinnamoneus]PPT16001.1 hypothetical protein CYQ11_26860 [Streptomyces cinnamoneus]